MDDMNERTWADADLLDCPDPVLWARRFMTRATASPVMCTEEETMLAWFAGAMAAGAGARIDDVEIMLAGVCRKISRTRVMIAVLIGLVLCLIILLSLN